jgi:hypothetical protein
VAITVPLVRFKAHKTIYADIGSNVGVGVDRNVRID